MHKPIELFDGENAFVVDAHYFFQRLVDTLTFLPHVTSLETVLESSEVRKIVIKSMQILSIFCSEQEFSPFFTQESQNIFL